MVVQLSKDAIRSGDAAIERELVQLSILNAMPDSEQQELSAEHSSDVIALARSRGLPVSNSFGSSSTIAELWEDRLRVTVIVACYNYGHFIDEAITSVLAQSYLPDEIILSDDASSDGSAEIMREYARRFPDTIRLNLNEQNQGIQRHFNQVAQLATGDLLMFLGADNRIPVNYVEDLMRNLAIDESVGIAYTDFALFGGRAQHDYERLIPRFQGRRLSHGVFLTNFPEFDASSRQLLDQGHNFIHGSSMYRKRSFEQVGGYGDRKNGPEDMSFFQSVLATGLTARKVTSALLEYRQHSVEQANYQFAYFGELQRLREENRELIHVRLDRERLREEIEGLNHTIAELRNSRSYRLGRQLLAPLRFRFRR